VGVGRMSNKGAPGMGCEKCNQLGVVEGVGMTWSCRPETIDVAIPCRHCRPKEFIRFYAREGKRTGNDELRPWAEKIVHDLPKS
jgi:hypothetical protein